MGLDKFLVVLDAPGAKYRPGDVVAGKVVVAVAAGTDVKDISVTLKGDSEVIWSQPRGRGRPSRWYKANENHVSQRVTLLGGEAQELLLPAGEHTYPFRAALPTGIPPSFEGEHGNVRYSVKASVQRSSSIIDDVSEASLVVLGDVDLNLQPTLRKTARAAREKTLSCWWEGPISVVLTTPATGVVPGQNVQVNVEVDNASSRRVNAVRCNLKQKVLFVTNRVRKSEDKVATVEMGSVEPHKSCTWTRVLALPRDLPPSGLPHCSIILVSYWLEVKAVVSGRRIPQILKIPMVVGTVPLTTTAALPITEPTAPPQPLEAPPPSYEETVYGTSKQLFTN